MISLENAKRLTELGYAPFIYCGGDRWLPEKYTLSQLLEEVEKRGYEQWELEYDVTNRRETYKFNYWLPRNIYPDFAWGHTPEDAVALALISILETGGKWHLSETKCDKGDLKYP